MVEERVRTGVDDLVQYLKEHGKASLKEVSSALSIPEATLQLWVDFLVEEQILGVEYKFTKPYIFLNKEDKARRITPDADQVTKTIEDFKNEFFDEARKKQLPEQQIPSLWQAHLDEALEKRKDFFLREANKRSIEHVENLFVAYKEKLARI